MAIIKNRSWLLVALVSELGVACFSQREPAPKQGQLQASNSTPRSTAPGASSFSPVSTSPAFSNAAPVATAEQAVVLEMSEELAKLRSAGLAVAADTIEARALQAKPKMKLTEEEAAKAALYAREELPNRPAILKLLSIMPKTAVELIRGIRERGVLAQDAESMARYLRSFSESMKMDNPRPFDENCSHVIARHWHEISTYQYEGMSWERQKKIYAPKGVPDFRSLPSLKRFFQIESKAQYFQDLYRPAGLLPNDDGL